MAIENSMITNSIERAQKQMEAVMFSIRKNLFEYDSVLNKQRQVIYGLRDKLLKDENVDEVIEKYIEDIITNSVEKYTYNKDMLVEYLKEVS
jgi:preprotein translocase subunit SecA